MMEINAKKKITIIGSNSYIARNLLKIIDRNKYIVKLYDYQEKSIDNEVNYTSINIKDRQSVNNIDVDCDVVIVFSGLTGAEVGFKHYEEFIDVNEKGILNVLDKMVEQNSRAKVIFPSTRLVYKGQKDTLLTESAEKEFKTLYALNKYTCEKYLEMYNNLYGINYCIIRICVPYGNMVEESNSYGTMGFFLSKAKKGEDISIYGDGLQKRSFIHIYDLCQVIIKLMNTNKSDREVFNVGGPEALSIYSIAKCIANLYKVQVKSIEWPEISYKLESGDTIFDSSKLDRIINYKYQYTYEKWIQEQSNII